MQKSNVIHRLVWLALAAGCLGANANARTIAQGEWDITSQLMTPQGEQATHEKVCNQGQDVADILMRQQGADCSPWKVTGSKTDGTELLQSVCKQPGPFPGGAMTLHVQAQVTVANDGRSARGSVQATGNIRGTPFTSPPTLFTSRFVGACPGR